MSASLRIVFLPVCCLVCLGCADTGIKTLPVAGKVTLNGKPFISGTATVLFQPDKAKANTSVLDAVGKIDEQGAYSLVTMGRPGAPPGWYKVVVTAFAGTPQHPKTVRDRGIVVRSLLPAKYGSVATTDLAVQVVENPASGAYDLKLKSE